MNYRIFKTNLKPWLKKYFIDKFSHKEPPISSLLDIRPSNIISVINCTYTYNDGVYHITKEDDSANVSMYFNMAISSDVLIKLSCTTTVAICNSNITPQLRYYNSGNWWGSVSTSYLNGYNVGNTATSNVLYYNTDVQFFFQNTPHEFDLDLSKLLIEIVSA